MPARKHAPTCPVLIGMILFGVTFFINLKALPYADAHEMSLSNTFRKPSLTLSPTSTQSFTPTRMANDSSKLANPPVRKVENMCPRNTPEPLWVEPVTSPTNLLAQEIIVRVGNSDSVTVTAESGSFNVIGSFSTGAPAYISITLLPNVTHHLSVEAHIKSWSLGDCQYPGYTLSTIIDRYGNSLTVVQQSDEPPSYRLHLPLITR